MTFMFAALLAAGASATPVINPNAPDYLIIASTEPVLQKNYPKESVELGEQGIVQFRILTSTSGQLGACQVVGSSGYARLDLATCDLLIGKTLFKRVVRNGAAVRGERFGQINWILPENAPKPAQPPAKSDPADLAKAAEVFTCVRNQETGSLVKSTKQCMRGGDFAKMQQMMNQEIDRMRMNTPQSTN